MLIHTSFFGMDIMTWTHTICVLICRYQPPCLKGVTDCLMFMSAATTKKVSAEIAHLVHEERLDLSISGGCMVCCMSSFMIDRHMLCDSPTVSHFQVTFGLRMG